MMIVPNDSNSRWAMHYAIRHVSDTDHGSRFGILYHWLLIHLRPGWYRMVSMMNMFYLHLLDWLTIVV